MIDISKTLFQFFGRIIGFFPSLIYSYIYSEFFTKATYSTIGVEAKKKTIKSVLDIGTATGNPLKSIVDSFGDAQVLGIDYDKHYIATCKKLFQKHPNVNIQYMNFYDLPSIYPSKTFDIIIFGSSFMIMPDQLKAVQIAKKKLNPGGRIYFLLTLYSEKTFFTQLMGLVKPYLKYLSTVDFGKITYKKDFEDFLEKNSLKTTCHKRCTGNFFLKYFKFYLYEVQNCVQ